MLKLECLGARHGDCIVLHHGDVRVLFDGGPDLVYENFLAPWIDRHKPVTFDLGIVTHIDDDHINGLLALTDEMCDRRSRRQAQDATFKAFWFNSFSGLTGQTMNSASVASIVASAGAPGFDPRDPATFADSRMGAIVASVAQGHRLSNNLGTLNLKDNGKFNGLVRGRKTVKVGSGGLTFDVVGPLEERLLALKKTWDEWAEKHPDVSTAAFKDRSIPNLSSIVIVAEADGKKILLTGDARGDDVLEYLEAAGYPTDGSFTFDVMKVAHHGSEHNHTLKYFQQLPARVYIISADGEHGNPDPPVIEWIAEARGKEAFEFVFASPMKTAAKQKSLETQLKKLQKDRNFTWRFRDKDELSITVDLS